MKGRGRGGRPAARLAEHREAPGVTIYELPEGECHAGKLLEQASPEENQEQDNMPNVCVDREFMRNYEQVLGALATGPLASSWTVGGSVGQ